VVFDSARGPESVPFRPFLERGPARSLPYRIPDQWGPKFLVIQNRSGAALSVSALSFPLEWLSARGSA